MALNLMGQCDELAVLSGEAMDVDECTTLETNKENMHKLLTFWCAQMQLALIFDDMDVACEMTLKIWKHRPSQTERTSFLNATFETFFYLCAMHLWKEKKRRKYRRKARKHLRELELWLKNKALNVQQKVLLVRAEEKAATKGHSSDEVRSLFDESITIAQRTGFPQDAALAAERAGTYTLNVGDYESGADYLARAQTFYKIWGAQGKVDHMTDKHTFLADRPQMKSHWSSFRGQARFSEIQPNSDRSFNPFKTSQRKSVYGMGLRRESFTIDLDDLDLDESHELPPIS